MESREAGIHAEMREKGTSRIPCGTMDEIREKRTISALARAVRMKEK